MKRLIVILVAAGCGTSSTGPSDGGIVKRDMKESADLATMGSADLTGVEPPDLEMPVEEDLSTEPADLTMMGGKPDLMMPPQGCIQVQNWPQFAPAAGYDSISEVTYVGSDDKAMLPSTALVLEDWKTMGEKWPKNATFMLGDGYEDCAICAVLYTCDAMGCELSHFAQAGKVTVTRADRNENVGRMTATAQGLTLIPWDFDNDEPLVGGKCWQIASASFDVPWPAPPPDGGVADMRPADMKPADAFVADLRPPDGGGACAPKVNELRTGGVPDMAMSASDEFVEIFNPCPGAINMNGWKLWYRSAGNNNGGADTPLYTFTQTIPAGGYLVIAGAGWKGAKDGVFPGGGLSAVGGAVGLRNGMNAVVDSVAWDKLNVKNNYTETTPAPHPQGPQGISRLPNGADTDDNGKDFKVANTTPKAANQ